MSTDVIIYGKNNCPYCDHAKNFFNDQNVAYTYYNTSDDPSKLEEMLSKGKGRTFPQIIINGHAIGGFSDMMKLHESGELKKLLDWWA